MNKEETLALWAQGKDAWNAWAKKMLDQRAEMEKAGTWAASRDVFGCDQPENEATDAWMTAARMDFTENVFDAAMDFMGTRFPGWADFNKATFRNEAYFDRTTFMGDAWFGHVTFLKDASFPCVKFCRTASFESAIFSGSAMCHGTMFNRNAWFGNATFRGNVAFVGTTFGGKAGFVQSRFAGHTRFERAAFSNQANFVAALVERGFTLERAQFAEVPDFIQAHFAEAPRIDNVRVRPGKADPDRAARYRALKRLAIDGHDHAREQEYFAGELKALRGHPDRLLPWFYRDAEGRRRLTWPGGGRYWFGLLYQAFSDFGQSIMRPLIWLGVTAFLSAWVYLGLHFARIAEHGRAYGLSSIEWIGRWIVLLLAGSPPMLSCIDGSSGEPWSAARLLALAKTLPYAGAVPAEKLTEMFSCLYGESIPSSVVVIGIVQLLLSLLLLFLFLLAVRNHFRIR